MLSIPWRIPRFAVLLPTTGTPYNKTADPMYSAQQPNYHQPTTLSPYNTTTLLRSIQLLTTSTT